ncbi:hypothetical protein KKG45_08140 [bacterium]|nr:hypothetical protein [bacterium]MBU1073203.1 hypothetical protein [bacterium]MBU1674716.1 hypothetical protein [bacterium]
MIADDGGNRRNVGDTLRLPRFSSLIIMLCIFLTISLLILFTILDRPPVSQAEAGGGYRSYGPADFPEIGFDVILPEPQPGAVAGAYTLPPPPFSDEDIFPCSGCHEDTEVDPRRRELVDYHEEILLNHGPEDRWCFDCHDPADRDHLRLANGSLIGFDESYRLCGQCHGTIFRDWRRGIHGRRRGYWNGAKSYLLCAHCHDPHAPHFAAIKPLPPKLRPELLGMNQGSTP